VLDNLFGDRSLLGPWLRWLRGRWVFRLPSSDGSHAIEVEDKDGDTIAKVSSDGTLLLDNGANTNRTIQLRHDNVDHGLTNITDATNVYCHVNITESSSGGVVVQGYKDADGANYRALGLVGYLCKDVHTAKTTGARGIVEIIGRQGAGTGAGNTVPDGNVLVVRTRRLGSSVTLLIVDEDGDLYYDGSAASYDQVDDIALLREVSDTLAGQNAAWSMTACEQLGIVHRDDKGAMVSQKRHTALLRGAVLQLAERVYELERKLDGLAKDRN